MAKGNFKSTTLPLNLWTFLDRYREKNRLRSIAQAIEFIVVEAGHNPNGVSEEKAEE